VLAETKGGTNPYFSTGAGGILQSVLMGFGGLEYNSKRYSPGKIGIASTMEEPYFKGVGVEKKTLSKIDFDNSRRSHNFCQVETTKPYDLVYRILREVTLLPHLRR
jgi:hypothetical protein